MSKYPIVTYNGLYGPQEAKWYDESAVNSQNLEHIISSVFSSEPERTSGRHLNMYTGREGMRAFDEAMQQEVEIQQQHHSALGALLTNTPISRVVNTDEQEFTWNLQGTPRYVAGIDPISSEGNSIGVPIEEQESVTLTTTIPYNDLQMTALQNGEIDMLTFLDNISNNDSNT